MRRSPRRPVCRQPRSKRSAVATRRVSNRRTKRSFIASARELFKTRRLSDATFNEAVTTLGETGLVEVIAIIGYYTLIGNTLNVFQVAVPEGTTPPFPE